MIAHVINVKYRLDRMRNFLIQAKEQGFSFIVHEADTSQPFPFMGIRESHQAIVRDAKIKGEKEVLIMEDDVCFSDKGAFDFFMSKKPDQYQMYLSSVYHGLRDNVVDGNLKMVNDFCGLHCYMVHESFYDTFLEVDGLKHIDRGLTGKGEYHVCYPFAAYQANGFSDNKRVMATYDHLMEGHVFYKQNIDTIIK